MRYIIILSLFLALFAVSPISQAANNVEIKYNGGSGPIYGGWNILEIWMENDATLNAMVIAFEFSGVGGITLDPSYGSHGYVNEEPNAAGVFNMGFFVNPNVTGFSPDSVEITGIALSGDGLPPGVLRLCYTMNVWIPAIAETISNGFCVDNIVYPLGLWVFGSAGGNVVPDFQGNPNASSADPDAPPVCLGDGPEPTTNNVELKYNGDTGPVPGEWNILEIWIENNAWVHAISLAFEFSGVGGITLDPSYGSHGYVNVEPNAEGLFALGFFVDPNVNGSLPDSVEIVGIGWQGGGLIPGVSRLCYTMNVWIPSVEETVPNGICVDNIVYPTGLWGFSTAGGDVAPDFQGNSNASMGNPSAPPVCIDLIGCYSYSEWPLDARSAGEYFGFSVAGIGDINLDGHDDFIVGGILSDVSGTDAGIAYVYSGSDGTVMHTMSYSHGAGGFFGWAVAGPGDVNGDGVPDIIVGEPGFLNETGYTNIFSGANPGFWLASGIGLNQGDWRGFAVAGAGDVDNDGVQDVIDGAPYHDGTGTNVGAAYVYSVNKSVTLHTFLGENTHDNFGWSVAGAGDINGDGFDDVIVGAPGYDATPSGNEGKVYFFSGDDGSLIPGSGYTGSFQEEQVGRVVSGGWHTSDGVHAYFALGAPYYGIDWGRVYIVRLNKQTDTWELFDVLMGQEGSEFGGSLAWIGDPTKGEHQKLAIGARGWNSSRGRVYLYAIESSSASLLTTFDGTIPSDLFGKSVSLAGDVTDDCYSDLIIGAPFASGDDGKAYVYEIYSVCEVCGCCNHDGIRGDVSYDMGLDVADVTYLVDYLFVDGPPPPCDEESDANGSGGTDVADLTYLVDYLFLAGPPPVACP